MSRKALAVVLVGFGGASSLGLRLPVSPIAPNVGDRIELDSLEALSSRSLAAMQPSHGSSWLYRPKMEETTAIPGDGTKTLGQSVP